MRLCLIVSRRVTPRHCHVALLPCTAVVRAVVICGRSCCNRKVCVWLGIHVLHRHLSMTLEPNRTNSGLSPPHANHADDATVMSPRARGVTLAANFAVTAYSTIITASTKLLTCVAVPGAPPGSMYLFVQGSVKCDMAGWQV